jgi:hypothetical protein
MLPSHDQRRSGVTLCEWLATVVASSLVGLAALLVLAELVVSLAEREALTRLVGSRIDRTYPVDPPSSFLRDESGRGGPVGVVVQVGQPRRQAR